MHSIKNVHIRNYAMRSVLRSPTSRNTSLWSLPLDYGIHKSVLALFEFISPKLDVKDKSAKTVIFSGQCDHAFAMSGKGTVHIIPNARMLQGLTFSGGVDVNYNVCRRDFTLNSYLAEFLHTDVQHYVQRNNAFKILLGSEDKRNPLFLGLKDVDVQNAFEALKTLLETGDDTLWKKASLQAIHFIGIKLRNSSLIGVTNPKEDTLALCMMNYENDDFTFVCCNHEYKCSVVAASILSPKANRLMNQGLTRLNIENTQPYTPNGFEMKFGEFFNFAHGAPFKIDRDGLKDIVDIAVQMENTYILDICASIVPQSGVSRMHFCLSLGTWDHPLVTQYKWNVTDEQYNKSGTNSTFFNSELLPLVQPPLLEKLVKANIKVNGEGALSSFLFSYINCGWKSHATFLLKYIKVQSLDRKIMRDFLESVNPNFITEEIWDMMGEIIMKYVK